MKGANIEFLAYEILKYKILQINLHIFTKNTISTYARMQELI